MRFNRKKFLKLFQEDKNLKIKYKSRAHNMMNILWLIETTGALNDVRHAAYVFATVVHESLGIYLPLEDYKLLSKNRYLNPKSMHGQAVGNKNLKDEIRYRGRGFVKIYGRYNYEMMTKYIGIGVDLVKNPEKAAETDIAWKILIQGMCEGKFNGHNLSEFINDKICDYCSARRVVDIRMKDALIIEGYAIKLESMLRASMLKPSQYRNLDYEKRRVYTNLGSYAGDFK